MKLIKNRLSVIVVLLAVLVMTGCGSNTVSNNASVGSGNSPDGAGTSETKTYDIKIVTNNQNTSVYVYSAAWAEVLKNYTPRVNMEVLPYTGAIGNVEILAKDEADVALMFNVSTNWAHNGMIAFNKPFPEIRGLAGGMNIYYVGIIAREEFLQKHGIESLADIKEKQIPVRVITNPIGSMAEYNTRLVLEAYGMNYNMIEGFGGSVEFTSNDVIKSTFQDGTSDLLVYALSEKHAVITEMALSTDIRLLGVDDTVMEFFKEKGFNDAVYPAGDYKNQDYEVRTPGYYANYIVKEDMDEELAYTLTKALLENKDALVAAHASVSIFDPTKAGLPEMNGGIELHPGAKRYYEEMGYPTE